MSKQIEALKLALEALEDISSHYMSLPKKGCMALAAIEEALADSALERMAENERELGLDYMEPAQQQIDLDALGIPHGTPFQPAQQEPVAWMHTNAIGHVYFRKNPQDKTLNPVPLYTSPPASKPWVGLTEAEHTQIAVECGCMSADWVFYGAAVERKLREKNAPQQSKEDA